MPYFRCFYMDEQEHIVFPAEIVADDIDIAKRYAFGVLEERADDFNRPIASLEIWQGKHRLFRLAVLHARRVGVPAGGDGTWSRQFTSSGLAEHDRSAATIGSGGDCGGAGGVIGAGSGGGTGDVGASPGGGAPGGSAGRGAGSGNGSGGGNGIAFERGRAASVSPPY
jgi:hypothetical protein